MIAIRQLTEIALSYVIFLTVERIVGESYPLSYQLVTKFHMIIYLLFFNVINLVKFLKGQLNFSMFWEAFSDEKVLRKVTYAIEFILLMHDCWGKWENLIVGFIYKWFLIQVVRYLQDRLILPAQLIWILIFESGIKELLNVFHFNFEIKKVLIVLLIKLLIDNVSWNFAVSIPNSEIIESPRNLHYPTDYRKLSLNSKNVTIHALSLLNLLNKNFNLNVGNKWLSIGIQHSLFFTLLLLQVQFEVLSINSFNMILQKNFGSIDGVRPGKDSLRYLRKLLLKIMLFNYVLGMFVLSYDQEVTALLNLLNHITLWKDYFWHAVLFTSSVSLGTKWDYNKMDYLYNSLSVIY